jgi:hypothetical protein
LKSPKDNDTNIDKDQQIRNRLIGQANEQTIYIEHNKVDALIDTGSMVSTLSEKYYLHMKNKPEMKTLEDFNIDIICANGQTIPYLGYIEVLIGLSDCHGIELYAPILIVPATE